MIERTNEEQLDLFADLLEPVSVILSDAELVDILQTGKVVPAVRMAIKRYKREVIQMLALIDGKDPAEYKVNLIALPVRLIQLLNRPEVVDLFMSQDQEIAAESSGPAMENTGGGVH